MRFHWLLPSTLSIFLLSSPAEAAKLQSWNFDANRNRLDFKTDGAVQPKAQLIFNPMRLVIDLPGTKLDRPTVKQELGGTIRSIRVGQFDEQTARVVIELSPGYKLDPEKVKFEGATPSQWTVQLPQPERVAVSPPLTPLSTTAQPSLSAIVPGSSSPNTNSVVPQSTTATVQVENIQVTADGLFVRTRGGGTPQIKVNRSSDRSTIDIDLVGASLAPQLSKKPTVTVNRYGVSRVQLNQVQNSPPVTRMTMRVDRNGPDWQATVSRFGGLVVLPQGRSPANTVVNTLTQNTTTNTPSSSGLATIHAAELTINGAQLLIRASQKVNYSGGWDRSTGLYRITIPNAQLASNVRGPALTSNSPVLRVRLQQADPRTVAIWVQPATGIRIGELNQPGQDVLALQLSRANSILLPPANAQTPPPGSQPVPVPVPQATTPPQPATPPANPNPPKQRPVVVIDPGHGGKDPGAIGIGGLQEKQVILPISKQIAAILEKEGIKVVMTRDLDYFVDLAPRVAIAERANADVFVSIHANSMGLSRPDVNGLETYYFSSGQRLAQVIHRNILQRVTIRDRGVRRARFYVLRKSSMPSVLVEIGYVTGREDNPRLRTAAYQTQMAEAIARGILQYLGR
ncbi:N-acetylmuramoyl-L-alanine amidase [Gloeocapsopsis dulcis]|uniref:N-acetylmuramoyl-L-alanine amidase n=1 Tax=Gloeocapsopsis dulcis AAB1 = 1H9 TaxID=1433147 RepID=A0A6N8FXE4_9CHRO|nr:N-acetylmuramoyl-L-alanine amidase [Gloeocapsopsis dulcis]MUL36995.1 N-acetylmuramoyl-L-alanine amidase [Gloeocapsopsis dulcis AAB1 = 1H9]WNN87848.1 N-acetylmuramoyl-L-alanine amidase [Gloeocapsopsis dulcis]